MNTADGWNVDLVNPGSSLDRSLVIEIAQLLRK
jgi:hypothetical protein